MLVNTGVGRRPLARGAPHDRRLRPSGRLARRMPSRESIFVTGAAIQWLRDGLGIIGLG